MEDDHFAVQVLTLDEHLAARRSITTTADSGRSGGDIEDEEEDEEDEAASGSVLIPVDSKERRTVLRSAGVEEINLWEKEECKQLRLSRQQCGCTCAGPCLADSCACAAGGIMCQVDRPGFPCGCSAEACGNPAGRLEFNPVKVRTHFVKTIMRTRIEEARSLQQQERDKRGDYFNCNLGYLAQLYGAGCGNSGMAGSSSQQQQQWSWADSPWWTSVVNGVETNEEEEEAAEEEDEEEEESSSRGSSESGQDEDGAETSIRPPVTSSVPATAMTNVLAILDSVIDSVCWEGCEAAAAGDDLVSLSSVAETEGQCLDPASEFYSHYSSNSEV